MRLVRAKNGAIPVDHEPPHVEAGAEDVADQDLEHLGHAPARGRRVDVPDGRVPEHGSGLGRRLFEVVEPALADQLSERFDGKGRDFDLAEWSHGVIIARFAAAAKPCQAARFPIAHTPRGKPCHSS